METSKFYFKNIDALKTIAVLAIFLKHSPLSGFMGSIPGVAVIWATISPGDLGTTFFFILSGFFVTYFALLKEEKGKSFNLKNFYLQRALRIFPLYYALIIFGLFIAPNILSRQPDIFSSAFYLAFLSNFDHVIADTTGLKPPMYLLITWNVSIGVQFYLLLPLIFISFKRDNRLRALLCILGGTLLFRLIAISYASWSFVYYHTITNFYYLTIGSIAAVLILYKESFRKSIENINVKLIFLVYFMVLSITFIKFIFWGKFFLMEAAYLFLSLGFTFIILEQCFAKKTLFEFRRLELLSYLGKYTFGMYLLHPVGLWITEIAFAKFGLRYGVDMVFAQFFTAFVISCVLALASYHLLERRFLKLRERLTSGRLKVI